MRGKTITLGSPNRLVGQLFLVLSVFAFSGHALADEGEELRNSGDSVVLQTMENFLDYSNETLDAIVEKGGSRKFTLPQWQVSPGWGPVAILPEFIGEVGGEGGSLPGPMVVFDVAPLPLDLNNNTENPEIPANNRTVVGFTEDSFTNPHIPPLRWTADGRVGVESQVGGGRTSNPVHMYLLAPEKLDKPFVETAPGPQALVLDRIDLPFEEFSGGRPGVVQHVNICDPFHADEGAKRNPYSCGANGQDDCYDVTLIASHMEKGNTLPNGQQVARTDEDHRLMGTEMHIRVTNPKTPQASIAEVTFGETKWSKARTDVLFETITPADGRLFIARRGFTPLFWQNTRTKETHLGSYDIVYAVSPPDSDPCDVTDWSDLYPITHAPYDDRVNERYLFAAQPFRDPSGYVIPDGVDIKGTYPWMDKEAKMFSMQVAPGKLFPSYAYDKNPRSRYPVRCVDEDNCSVANMADSDNSKDNLFVIVGAWTQGKMVLLDGLLNDIDFRLGGKDQDHSYLSLYQPGTGNAPGDSGEKRVGSTRFGGTAPVRNEAGEVIGEYGPRNASMFDSPENRLNYLKNMKPTTPQDIVWLMSSGHSTEELAFDDYLNPDGFIVSNMVGHLEHRNDRWYKMDYFDGWQQWMMSFSGQVRVQNSATALPERWKIPSYGRVRNGRLEPVANGGVRGKGMWFNGRNTRVEYEVPEQPQSVLDKDWYYGLFIDPRNSDDGEERVLIKFPDNSKLTLTGLSTLRLRNHRGYTVAKFSMPEALPSVAWTHLGLLVHGVNSEGEAKRLELFLNGFPFWDSDNKYGFARYYPARLQPGNFRPTEGELRLGDDNQFLGKTGFNGWMDEFKVFAWEPNLESVCNFAHGTMVGLTDSVDSKWHALAESYPASSHERVTEDLLLYGQEGAEQYVCYHDYTGDHKAHLASRPEGSEPLRDAFHFPEGPLFHDAPRPDSSANEFCLSCHHDGGVGGLSLDALSLADIDAKFDHRRQPSQPPPRAYGNIPANWFPGAPSSPMDAGEAGALIDEWLMPSETEADPNVLNLVFADDEGDGIELIEQTEYQADQLSDDIVGLRANVDGLVREVTFTVNGESYTRSQVPFVLELDLLASGENQISVQGTLDNGGTTSIFEQVLVLEGL